eukprot:Stramenopile-MAST_4_protein_5427
MVLNQERPAQNTEYVVCKRTGDKIRADTWESYSNSLSTEIMPYMFLGGERNAGNHKELGFRTHCGFVLNLAWEVANFFPGEFEYLKLGLSDFSDNATALYDQLEIAMKFIDRSRENNSSVLVHCVQGISRSSTIVISYLMTRESMSLQEAYKHALSNTDLARMKEHEVVDCSTDIVLHEDKNYYASTLAVFGEGVEALTMEDDSQSASEPLVAPLKEKSFGYFEGKIPELKYTSNFLTGFMGVP